MKWAAGEYNISEKKSPGTKAETSRKLDDGIEAQKIGESWTETKKRGSEDEIEIKVEMKNKGGFEGGRFIGRKKVLHLASSPSTSDGGTDSPGATSPSPTKITPSPRRKESESSGQDYSL